MNIPIKLSIVIPCYNEVKTISIIIKKINSEILFSYFEFISNFLNIKLSTNHNNKLCILSRLLFHFIMKSLT